ELYDSEVTLKREPWSHTQAFKDALLTFAVLLGLTVFTLATGGPELSAPADPSIEYVARPEWYFLPVFRLRHYFVGDLEFIATALLPGLATVALAALPFIHLRLQK